MFKKKLTNIGSIYNTHHSYNKFISTRNDCFTWPYFFDSL